jgi:hypothetical protein
MSSMTNGGLKEELGRWMVHLLDWWSLGRSTRMKISLFFGQVNWTV